MRKIKLYIIIILSLLIKAQELEKMEVDSIYSLSLEELMKVKINVSSTIPKSIFESPSTITIIDRNLIEQYNFMSVSEAIRTVAGVSVLQTNLDRNVPTFRGILQNYYANKILILINNIPVWQPIYGNSTLDRISINDIEKIEILKGPASVLYGTNAFNGVINLLLRNNSEDLNVRIDAGYPELSSTSVNYSFITGDFKFYISGNTSIESRKPYNLELETDSIFLGKDYRYGNIKSFNYKEEIKQFSLNFVCGYKSHTFLFNAFNNTYTYPGVDISYATGGGLPFTDRGFLLAYQLTKEINNDVELSFQSNFEYFDRDYKTNPDRTNSLSLAGNRLNSQLKINYNYNKEFQFEIGTDFTLGHSLGHKVIAPVNNQIIRSNMKDEEDLLEWSFFGQINYKLNNLNFLLGSRYTGNKIFGNNISSRITSVFLLDKKNSIKVILGQSFRTPNMLELYFDHPTVVGNKELKPETSSSVEIVYLSHIYNELFFHINVYRAWYNNFITRVRPDITKPAYYRNRCEFKGNGLELEVKYENLQLFSGFLNYNYLSGDGNGAEANFQFIPKHTISAGIQKKLGQFSFSLNGYYYSMTKGIINNIDSQLNLNFTIGYTHKISKFRILHNLVFDNITKSDMLIPEYIRKRPHINDIKTAAFGQRIIYTLTINY